MQTTRHGACCYIAVVPINILPNARATRQKRKLRQEFLAVSGPHTRCIRSTIDFVVASWCSHTEKVTITQLGSSWRLYALQPFPGLLTAMWRQRVLASIVLGR
jgi:hypothetical protein